MIAAPYPQDEMQRLRLLQRSGLLEAAQDPFLDALTVTVARTFSVPICAVSLIDRDRQFFKASVGLAVRETPRSCSFCAHVLWWPAPMVVLDASADPRFTDNPLVLGGPSIRFYAGSPIYLRGVCVGTLCLIDHRSKREFDERDQRHLQGAAAAVEERLIQIARWE